VNCAAAKPSPLYSVGTPDVHHDSMSRSVERSRNGPTKFSPPHWRRTMCEPFLTASAKAFYHPMFPVVAGVDRSGIVSVKSNGGADASRAKPPRVSPRTPVYQFARNRLESVGDRLAASGALWRPMAPAELPAVEAIAAKVHPAYPEEGAIFAERLHLYPRGCFVLDNKHAILGYVVSHPWKATEPPHLNTLVGTIPVPPGTYYLHDIALLPGVRGLGYGDEIVQWLVREAKLVGLTTMSLVAVNGTVPFWTRHGFAELRNAALEKVLPSYGAGAAFMVRDLSALGSSVGSSFPAAAGDHRRDLSSG
jgi:GNAT superfamily N-acetyltransferase